MELPELPECPVCLQYYDDENAIPRVLSCGHTVCEACLVELPPRFPNTIRCPACTQLVNFSSKQGVNALPKNIDLLRLCLQQHSSSSSYHQSRKANQRSTINGDDRSRFWSDELYATWKDWILPHDAVSVDENGPGMFGFGLCSLFKGRACFGANRAVSLFRIISLPPVSDSKFKFSYVARVIKCLEEMDEVLREGLALILEASVRQSRVCRVYGLWCDVVGGSLYLVCERHRGRFGELRNEDGFQLDKGGVCRFAMIAKGICEAVLALHLEGLVTGCLGLSCFSFDELGGICIDLNEVMVGGRGIMDSVSGGLCDKRKEGAVFKDCLKNKVLVSPEVLSKLLHKWVINSESGDSRYSIGYGSDVWSLACVLLRLLIGNELPWHIVEMSEEDGVDVSASYISWVEKVSSVLEEKIGSEYSSLRQTLCKCLDRNPESRPDVVDVRKCIQDVLVDDQFGFLGDLEVTINRNKTGHRLVLANMCQLFDESSKELSEDKLQAKEDGGQPDFLEDGEDKSDEDFVAGLSKGMTELKDLQGHRDCISGLVVGGMNFEFVFKH